MWWCEDATNRPGRPNFGFNMLKCDISGGYKKYRFVLVLDGCYLKNFRLFLSFLNFFANLLPVSHRIVVVLIYSFVIIIFWITTNIVIVQMTKVHPFAVDKVSVIVGENDVNCIICYVKFIYCNKNAEDSLFYTLNKRT